jgi:hypothetical protein
LKFVVRHFLFLVVPLTGISLLAADSNLPLTPIFQFKIANGKQRFGSSNDFDYLKVRPQIECPAFMAVYTNVWLPGLVPIFAVEKTNRFELRRRPPRGQEDSTEPLFFALPLDDEPDALAIAGRWDVDAIRGDSRVDFAFEFTTETNTVAGRFDQYSEYRFAYLMGGTFNSNLLQLRVEYISDIYLLTATLAHGELIGDWRRSDNSEVGTWKARRRKIVLPPPVKVVELHEWRRGHERRYTAGVESPGVDWQRSPRPLCKVWPLP